MVKISSQNSGLAQLMDRPEMFSGVVKGQPLVADSDAPSLRVAAITFEDGARNVWHRHTAEQVLVVTSGHGIVADAEGEHTISVGDVVLIQPNERHWHGAVPTETMTHLSILLPSEMLIDEDQG